jgi:predicted DNA-binding protein (MmcQ/YjbR family)
MDDQQARHYILSKPEAIEDFPFGPGVSVFKVKGKMFATLGLKAKAGQTKITASINLKCDPEQAVMLRDIFSAVIPGYHMNKRHWNTVILDTTIPAGEIERMIDHSYGLVVKAMTKKTRESLALLYTQQQLCQ